MCVKRDRKMAMASIDLATYSKGLVDGDTTDKPETRREETETDLDDEQRALYECTLDGLSKLSRYYLERCEWYVKDFLEKMR